MSLRSSLRAIGSAGSADDEVGDGVAVERKVRARPGADLDDPAGRRAQQRVRRCASQPAFSTLASIRS